MKLLLSIWLFENVTQNLDTLGKASHKTPDVSRFQMVECRPVYERHLKTDIDAQDGVFISHLEFTIWNPHFLEAISNLQFEIQIFWWSFWIYHLKSRLFGGHFVLTIWKPDFLVRISNGKSKMAAKNNIIDNSGKTF